MLGPSRLLRVLKSTPLIHVRPWYTKGFCCAHFRRYFRSGIIDLSPANHEVGWETYSFFNTLSKRLVIDPAHDLYRWLFYWFWSICLSCPDLRSFVNLFLSCRCHFSDTWHPSVLGHCMKKHLLFFYLYWPCDPCRFVFQSLFISIG